MKSKQLFVSHSSKDRGYILELKNHIESSFENIHAFVATDSFDMPSGVTWFDWIVSNLEKSQIFVLVLTHNARDSMWAGFELGYFWNKLEGNGIHFLFYPGVELPSPLNEKQGKNLTDPNELASFFRVLAEELGFAYCPVSVDHDNLVKSASEKIPNQMLNRDFEAWKTHLKESKWAEEQIRTREGKKGKWTCLDDMSFQIELDRDQSDDDRESHEFSEEWAKSILPHRSAYSYDVNLNVSGATVKQVTFVSLEDGRFFVPLPQVNSSNVENEQGELTYYYVENSLSFLLGKVIGTFYYPWMRMEGFAHSRNIEIVGATR